MCPNRWDGCAGVGDGTAGRVGAGESGSGSWGNRLGKRDSGRGDTPSQLFLILSQPFSHFLRNIFTYCKLFPDSGTFFALIATFFQFSQLLAIFPLSAYKADSWNLFILSNRLRFNSLTFLGTIHILAFAHISGSNSKSAHNSKSGYNSWFGWITISYSISFRDSFGYGFI